MKTFLLLLAVIALSSCEKARKLASGFGKPTPPAAAAPSSGPLVTDIPEGSYDTFPLQSGKVVVIDFHADWCGPCRQLAPILDQIATEHHGTVVVGKVNVDQFRQLAAQEGVRSIPDVRIYRDGKLVDKFVGLPDASEVRRRIENQAKGLPVLAQTASDAAKPKSSGPVAMPMTKGWMPEGMKRR